MIRSLEVLAAEGIGDLSFGDMIVFKDDRESDRASDSVEREVCVSVVAHGRVDCNRIWGFILLKLVKN